MGGFAHIKRGIDLSEVDVADAIASRESVKELLLHMSACSAPNTGGAKVLLMLARMGTTSCEWLEGDLRIEIMGDKDVSVVEVLIELGGGMRERVYPPFPFKTP